jgi:hypothetical protein
MEEENTNQENTNQENTNQENTNTDQYDQYDQYLYSNDGYTENHTKREPIKIPDIDYSKMFKELTILNNIKTYITYINADNEIETITQKKIPINNNENIITRKQLLEVVKNNQRKNNTKYKLISVMVYNIHVTPESLPNYIENPNDFISLFTLNRIESFELKPTLRLLKKYNGIYFFFFECPDDNESPLKKNVTKNADSFIRHNNTKRIHIRYLDKNQRKQNHKTTKRYDRYVNMF